MPSRSPLCEWPLDCQGCVLCVRGAPLSIHCMAQEALARLQRSFEIDAALRAKRDQRLIDEALASGPEEPLTRAKMDKTMNTVLGRKKP